MDMHARLSPEVDAIIVDILGRNNCTRPLHVLSTKDLQVCYCCACSYLHKAFSYLSQLVGVDTNGVKDLITTLRSFVLEVSRKSEEVDAVHMCV